jgi:outer membrane protein TolC
MRSGARLIAAGLLVGLTVPSVLVAQENTDYLSLRAAVERGLARYPSVRAARAGADAAQAAVGQATADWFPAIALDASITRFSDPMLVYPIHAFELEQIPPFDPTLTRASGLLSYTLFDGFARSARVRTARADQGVAAADVMGSEQEVTARVANAYLDVLGKREVLDAHDQRLVALRSELDRVQQLLDAGRAARLEVLRVEAELASSQADRVAAAIALDVAERELGRLIEAPVTNTRSERLDPLTLREAGPTLALPNLVERAVVANPLAERSRRQRDAAAAAVSAANSSWWPKLGLTGRLIDYGSPNTDHRLEWDVGLAIQWPVFTGLKRSRSAERATAQLRAADEGLRLAELQIAQSVDRAYSVVREANARVASLRVAVASFEEVTRIEQLRLDTGTGVQTDFLRAEAELLVARAGLAETRHLEMMAHVELARVLGELSPGWLTDNLEIDR